MALLTLEAAKLVLMHAAGPAPLDGDAGLYWKLGEQVAAGDLAMRVNPVGFRTPGYPWCLGIVRALCGTHAWHTAIALQHVAVFFTTVLTGWWTYRLTGRMVLANVAILVRVISLANAGYASTVLTETVFEPVFLLLVITLTTPAEEQTDRTWWWIGGLFAGAFLLRPAVLAIAPVIALTAMTRFPWPPSVSLLDRSTLRRLGIVVTVGLLLIGPWCVRNAVVFGRPVPVIFFGRELWMSVYGPGSPTGPTLPDSPQAERVRRLLGSRLDNEEWRINWSVSAALTQSGLNDAEADSLMQQVAWEGLQRNPLRWVGRAGWRSIDVWRTVFSRELFLYGDTPRRTGIGDDQSVWGSEKLRSVRAQWLDAGLETRLLPIELGSLFGLLGAVGWLIHPRTAREGWIVGGSLVCVGLLTGILEYPNYRYRMVLEPLLIVSAVGGAQAWFTVIQRGRRALRGDARSDECFPTDKL